MFFIIVLDKKRGRGGGGGALDFQHRVTPTKRIWLVVKMSDHISESEKGSQGVANWRFKLQNSFIL